MSAPSNATAESRINADRAVPTERYRYDAFISYRQRTDATVAEAVQRALHQLAKPWFKLRALRTFRDASSIAANNDLWATIARAIEQSRHFVLVTSAAAVADAEVARRTTGIDWVSREIAHWQSVQRERAARGEPGGSMIIVCSDGKLAWNYKVGDWDWAASPAIPPVLSGCFSAMPLYIDLSWATAPEQLSSKHHRFQKVMCQVAAPIHGVELDAFENEDVRQHRHTRRLARAATVGLVALTIAASVTAVLMILARNQAARERDRAEENVERNLTQLIRARIKNGLALVQRGDVGGGLPWFVDALALAEGHRWRDAHAGAREQTLQRIRLATFAAAMPRLDAVFLRSQGVQRSAVSSDGNIFASVGVDGKVWVVDRVARTERMLSWNAEGAITCLNFSPDGKRLLAACRGIGRIKIDPVTRRVSETFNPNRDFGGKVVVWETANWEMIATLRHPGEVFCAAFAPDSAHMLTGGEQGWAAIWDVVAQQVVLRLEGHSDSVEHVRFGPGGRRVMTAARDKTARVWDAQTGKELHAPTEQQNAGGRVSVMFTAAGARSVSDTRSFFTDICFSPDGRAYATAADRSAHVWDTESGAPLSPSIQHFDQINSICFSPDGKTLLTASRDGSACLWDASSGAQRQAPLRHSDAVTEAQFSADGQSVLTHSRDGMLRLWNAKTGTPVTPCIYQGKQLNGVHLLPEHGAILAVCGDGGMRLWKARPDEAEISQLPMNDINFTEFSGDGRLMLVTTYRPLATRIFSTTNFEAPPLVLSEGEQAFTATFDDRGTRVVASILGNKGRMWDLSFSPPIEHKVEIEITKDVSFRTTFSRDGSLFTTAGTDRIARVWDAVTAKPLSPQLVHHDDVSYAVLSPGNHVLVTSSGLGREGVPARAIVWDWKSGTQLRVCRIRPLSLQYSYQMRIK